MVHYRSLTRVACQIPAPRTLSRRSATGKRAVVNEELRLLVSLPSVWSSLVVGLLTEAVGVNNWAGVDVAGVNVGGNGVLVGTSCIAVCFGGSSSVRME